MMCGDLMDKKRKNNLHDALKMLSSIVSIVETVCNKEEDCMENYPENLQGSDVFEHMETAVDNLNDALEKLNDAKGHIEAAIG